MRITANQAPEMIAECIYNKVVLMLTGSPGIGKSAIIHTLAEQYNLKVIDLRLAQCDPPDLLGFPNIVGDRATYCPMSTFPIEGDEIPEGYAGWLLFLDEFNSADRSVQKAAYKLLLDREVGEHRLHKNVAIVCAGNLATDNAIVEDMSTALQSRLVHLELAVDSEAWLDWAQKNGVDHRITAFIKFKPQNLYTFKPDHPDNTYACPRTWEFANRFLNSPGIDSELILPLLAGTLSEGVAREFLAYTKIYQDLPTLEQINQDPYQTVPTEPSVLYALTGAIGYGTTVDMLENIICFVSRMPAEFQVICMRELVSRKPEMLEQSAVQTWISNNGNKFF